VIVAPMGGGFSRSASENPVPTLNAVGLLEQLAPRPQLAVERVGRQCRDEPVGRVEGVAEA
jgi:hypothetical protein